MSMMPPRSLRSLIRGRACMPGRFGKRSPARRRGLSSSLTPEEAGEHAKRAGARRVVITHISDELGDDWAREEAERGFGGGKRRAESWSVPSS